MGGNIPGGNFLARNFPGGNSPGGSLIAGNYLDGNFPGGSFPETVQALTNKTRRLIKVIVLIIL